MPSSAGVIRTPDQRLRVFVSSTLGEVAPERAAVRAAVERLHLSPVMFELGARPHPPRELYRAYLAQSHVFVGIYWESYGWIAPGEARSGLEDEYRLAGDRPRLLYVKEPAANRDARLAALIGDFQHDDRASYKRFATPDELAALVANDLAVLLSERFEEASATSARDVGASSAPPLPLTETIGRDDEIAAVADLLRQGQRLVTLTGTGGIGKTRIALEVARAVGDEHPDGVYFVALASVSDPRLVMRELADQLSIRVEGNRQVGDAVVDWCDRRALLVVDNFEQVVGAGDELAGLLEQCGDLRMLVTSRQALRVRGEREVAVTPLPLPDPAAPLRTLADQPAVRLFVDRARAVSVGFDLTEENAASVAELCRRLDGLPLAIELAAARVRLLPPAALLERLGDRLDMLAGGPDRPERQRTLRATIDWSHQLLTEEESALFARLGVFVGGWALDAADEVCGGLDRADFLETLASLLDKALIVTDEQPVREPRFRMLETVRTYALDRLDDRGETDLLRDRHLNWYRRVADIAQPFLCGAGQRDWAARFDPERANLRAAVARALECSDDVAVIELVWDVIVFYFVRDAVDEPESWMDAVLAAGRPLDDVSAAKLRSLRALVSIMRGSYEGTRDALEWSLGVFRPRDMSFEAAVALKELANVHFVLDGNSEAATADLEESIRLFELVDHEWGVALTETMLGTVLCVSGRLDEAEAHHQRSLDWSRGIENDPLAAQALQQIAMARILEGRVDDAIGPLEDATRMTSRARYQTGAAYCLDAVAAIALARGDAELAAGAVAMADATRTRLGIPVWPTVRSFVEELENRARRQLGSARFDDLPAASDDRTLFETLDEALRAVEGRLPDRTDVR